MAILAFQKPDKVVMLEADNQFGKFEFRPLEPGFGVTIGNALRRILLSSLEGYAVNTIRIAGVEHEFSSVPGVKEDVTNVTSFEFCRILNGDTNFLILEFFYYLLEPYLLQVQDNVGHVFFNTRY